MKRRDLADLLLEDDHAPGCPASRSEAETRTRTGHDGRPEVVTIARCQDCGGQRVHLGDVEHNLTVAEVAIGQSSDDLSAANMRTQQRRVSRLMARRRRAERLRSHDAKPRASLYTARPTLGLTVARRSPASSGRPRARRTASAARAGPGDDPGGEPGEPPPPSDAGHPLPRRGAFSDLLEQPGTGPERLASFYALPDAAQAAAWRSLRRAIDRAHDHGR